MRAALVAAAALLAACGSPAPPALEARVACSAEGHPLRQRCAVTLTDRNTGRPLEGAQVTLSADMPSMPMAHSAHPVTAEAGPGGTYTATLELEMRGRWVIAVRIQGPVSDQVTHAVDIP